MSGIIDAVDLSLVIDGSISVKPYQAEIMPKLNVIQLWEHFGINQYYQIQYGDEYWCSPGNKNSLTFYNATPKLVYQLKSLALGMYTQGIREGMPILSWYP